MERGGLLVAALFSLTAFGCAGSFTRAAPASYREPATTLAASYRATATPPVMQEQMATDALRDVRAIGNAVLLDFSTDRVDRYMFFGLCGPLELRGEGGRRVWQIERPSDCDDRLLTTEPRLTFLGRRAPRPKAELTQRLFTLDPAKGTKVAEVEVGGFFDATMSNEDIVLFERQAGKRRLVLHAGANLAKRWEAAIEDAAPAITIRTVKDTILVFGASITAIHRATGKVLRTTALNGVAAAAATRTGADAAYAMVGPAANKPGAKSLVRVNADGAVAWRVPSAGVVDGAVGDSIVVVDRTTVTAHRASDGGAAWTATLPGAVSGPGLLVAKNDANLLLVPHEQGVTALDANTGVVAFTVTPFARSVGAVADHLWSAGDDLVVLDTAQGIAGLDLAKAGQPRYVIPVRSLVHVTRQGRIASVNGGYKQVAAANAGVSAARQNAESMNQLSATAGGGMMMGSMQIGAAGAILGAAYFDAFVSSLRERRADHLNVALQQTRLDDESPFVTRPISWSTGRGLLVVRKRDGAFREIVTGPPDVYEDPFRASSVGAVLASGTSVLTFAEGVDASKWQDRNEEDSQVRLVRGSLLSYALDEASFFPATEYEKRSLVPRGSF